MKLADLRQEYMRAGLSETDVDRDPLRQFQRWLDDALAAKLPLPNAMTLATVDADGHPSARVVLLKGIESGGFVFFTNYRSRKGRELAVQPYASLVFQWPALERQVRIDGSVRQVSAAVSDAYYASRPLGARLSAWASAQSEQVASRSVLEKSMKAARAQHGNNPPRPPHWGGYSVVPAAIEFWQGRANRLHDRLRYVHAQAGWKIERLAP